MKMQRGSDIRAGDHEHRHSDDLADAAAQCPEKVSRTRYVEERRSARFPYNVGMTSRRRTGLPDVDPLIEVHEVAQAALDGTMVVGAAEGVIAGVRQVELAGEQQAARRRLAAARGRLTRARRDGSAARIAAAAARVDAANAEFDAISERVIAEMFKLVRARHEHLDQLFTEIDRSWTAGAAVLDALAHPAEPGRPGNGEDAGQGGAR